MKQADKKGSSRTKNMKKFLLVASFLFFVLYLPSPAKIAAGDARPMEVNYPVIGGESPQNNPASLPGYVKYIYIFSISISGVVALGVLIYAGFRYLTSAGDATKLSDAKNQMLGALLGLVLLLMSFLILNTINPNIPKLNIYPPIPNISILTPGTYICQSSNYSSKIEANWRLQQEYYGILKQLQDGNFPEEQIKSTFDRLKQIGKTIDENKNSFLANDASGKPFCRHVQTEESVDTSVERQICFVPSIKNPLAANPDFDIYGAILSGQGDYKLKNGPRTQLTQVFFEQYGDFNAVWCGQIATNLGKTAIKPFIFTIDCLNNSASSPVQSSCGAVLFEKEDFNKGFSAAYVDSIAADFGSSSYSGRGLLSPPPKSMKVLPGVIAILYKNPNSQGLSEGTPFLPGDYTNLLVYDGITNWVPCQTPGINTLVQNDQNYCAQPAATTILFLPASSL